MDRKKFLKNCLGGVCSCAALGSFVRPASVSAETEPSEDWRFPFMQQRYAKLFEILTGKMSDTELAGTIKELGLFCGSKSKIVQRYKGDIDSYIPEMIKLSGDQIVYDKTAQTITVTGADSDSCFCPLVDKNLMSPEYCECSLGWQQYAFETLLGKKVKPEVTESVLRGGKRCSFKIYISDEKI